VPNLIQDFRFALRRLMKSPGFTLTAVLTLGLGIGAATAIFSVVDGVLLKPLAYRDSRKLVAIWERVRFLEKLFPYTGPNPRHEQVWANRNTVFSDLTLLQESTAGVSVSGDHPRFVGRLIAQPNLFEVLGVRPALGRPFLPEESLKGHENVAIISWNLWQSMFQGSADVIGKSVRIAGIPRQIVGVLPRDFYFPKANELAPSPEPQEKPEVGIVSPLVLDYNDFGWNSDYGNYVALGRLKADVNPAQAQSQLDTIANAIVRQIPPEQSDGGDPKGALATYVQPLKEVIVGRTTGSLWLLFAAVLSVLLVACVNLANAQLARSATRDRESALRSALGASAGRLVQSSLAEVCLLSLSGGALGVLLAIQAVHRMAGFAHTALPRTDSISVNPAVLTLSVLLTVGATVLFGILPAMRLLRIKPLQVLHGAGRSTGSTRNTQLRRWLIGGQVMACTALLLVTGLLAKNLAHLLVSDKGFSTDHIVVADVLLLGSGFTDDKRAGFDDGVLDRLRALPGVHSAGLVSAMLLEGETWIDGVNRPDQPDRAGALANYRWISPGYFPTLQQRIVAGRDLDAHDRSLKNAVISETTAKAVWPNQDPLGHQFLRNGNTLTVVGVVADARNNSLRAAPVNMVYLPYWDKPPYGTYFMVRSSQSTALLAAAVREAIWGYNPEATIARIHTLDSQVSDSLAPERMETAILSAFGGSALLLALLGIYGTLSYSVEARTHEIGLRMALGATRQGVYGVILKEIVAPVGIGLGLGWLASVGIGKSIGSLLYGIEPNDMTVAICVVGIFALAALGATFLPCRRAASIEPMEALRME
jgi:predicted permease